MMPKQAYDLFCVYIRQLAPAKNNAVPFGKTQFLKNYNRSKKKRYQNMGKDRIRIILRRIELFLGLEPNSLTAHVFRRSAATELANSGISLLGLKRAGRWKNLQTAEEYLEHSLPVLRDRMNRLDTTNAMSVENVSKNKTSLQNMHFDKSTHLFPEQPAGTFGSIQCCRCQTTWA